MNAKRSSERTTTVPPSAQSNGPLRWVKLAILAGVIAGAAFGAQRLGFFDLRDPQRLAEAIRKVRQVRGIVPLFIVAYGLIASLGLPGFPLTLAGGAIFGLALGSALSWLGALLGACGAYWLARALGGEAIRGLLGKAAGKLDALGERHGFATILRLRLITVMPFNVVNLASGLARVPFREFVAGTALGIIPGTIIYTYFADSLVAGASGAGRTAFVRATLAAALLLALSLVPTLVRRLRGRPSENA
ncbi:MAG: TVP38/TMEM64 family protein [Gemmatimonadaceae bacterium]